MGLFKNERINIVITNRHLRYTDQSLNDHGELELPKETIVDGKIENKPILQKLVTGLVKEKKWRRNKLFFSVPDDTVVIRELQVPASLTEEEALGYVNMQLGKSYYLPFTNPAIAIDLLESDGENRKVLIYAYPKEQVTNFEDVFAEAGLKPVVADLTALSVYRYYYPGLQNGNSHVLLLHWNIDTLVITAFNQHKAVFSRYLKYADRIGEKFDAFEMDEQKAAEIVNDLLIEINRILDFYQYSITQGESVISTLILSGDFHYMDVVKKKLNETIKIPIHDHETNTNSVDLPLKYVDVLALALKKEE